LNSPALEATKEWLVVLVPATNAIKWSVCASVDRCVLSFVGVITVSVINVIANAQADVLMDVHVTVTAKDFVPRVTASANVMNI